MCSRLGDFRRRLSCERSGVTKSCTNGFPALTSTTVYEALSGFENTIAQRGGADERTEKGRQDAVRLIQTCKSLPSGPSPTGVLPFDETAATLAAYIGGRLFTLLAKKENWLKPVTGYLPSCDCVSSPSRHCDAKPAGFRTHKQLPATFP